jgi:hypothetical protein
MQPTFLLPDQTIRQDGTGPAIDLGSAGNGLLSLTLGINRIIEQESIDIAIYGSADGQIWGDKPLLSFPQKFYCGVYSLMLDLSAHPDVRFLRTGWKMNRWGRGSAMPLFGLYLVAEPAGERAVGARA